MKQIQVRQNHNLSSDGSLEEFETSHTQLSHAF